MKSLYAFMLENHDPLDIFSAVQAQPYSLFLDSAASSHPAARYSFIAFDPLEKIEAYGDRITVINTAGTQTLTGDPFLIVKDRLSAIAPALPPRADLPPFQGGAAGFFGYELAWTLEKLPPLPPASSFPDMAVGIYDQVVAFDHKDNKSWLMIVADNEQIAAEKYAAFQHRLEKTPPPPATANFEPAWTASFTRDAYEDATARVIEYIRAGDIFQANLSQRFEAAVPPGFDSFVHYRRLRRVNPAPFAAYMNMGAVTLASCSPERFLHVRDGRVETRPIKGTRPRDVSNSAADAALRHDLLNSAKDRAENIMIVDLLRNDLSKVCDDSSVDVTQLCALESFAAVHHLVSTVTGTLRADQTALDLLRACFPGGSITGAPKIRAMEIIAALEQSRRGPYCGAMGYIGFNGAMDTNIAIRTLVYADNKVSFNTGGGITADSNPSAEYKETLDKAAAIFKSFKESYRGGAENAEKELLKNSEPPRLRGEKKTA